MGILPLHGAMLKTAKPLQGPAKRVGPTFHKRVFSERPVSKFTVAETRK
jgi:hypothetical protein